MSLQKQIFQKNLSITKKNTPYTKYFDNECVIFVSLCDFINLINTIFMMTKNILRSSAKFLFVLFSLSLFLTSCNKTKKKKIEVDKGFTAYISGFTSGIISNSDDIIIELSEDRKEAVKDIDLNDLFKFSPKIEGTTLWSNSNEITFHPNEKLPSGTSYEVEFDLAKVMDVPDKYSVFKYSFQTKTQSIDVYMKGMQAYQSDNFKWNKVEGDVETADFFDEKDVENLLSATQNSKQKNIHWQHYPELKKHHFVIDSIIRGDDDGEVYLQWNLSKIDTNKTDLALPKTIDIPAIGNFTVMNVKTISEPEQIVEVYFSDPVNPKQNLRGLVYIKGKRIRTYTKGNMIKIYPQKRIKGDVELYVERGVRNTMGNKLRKAFHKKITFVSLKPDVKSVVKGVVMPNSKGLIFPFQAVSLKAVDVKIIKIFENNISQFFQVNQFDGKRELTRVGRIVYNKEVVLKSEKAIDLGVWNTFALDLSDLIEVEPGAVYRVEITFNKKQILWKCDNTDEKSVSYNDDDSRYDGPQRGYYDYYDYDYDYDYRESKNPCNRSYYTRSFHKIKQNILASNFGIIAKEDADHTINVFVTDLLTTENLSGVKIKVYNYQHKLMGESTTNAQGNASMAIDGKPFLLVAQKDGQYGYLRLDDGVSLSMSMFNVGGNKIHKGVKGYLYGERGVWRPGDSIYLNFVLEDKNKTLAQKHPVVLELFTPDNQLYLRRVNTKPVGNFYNFNIVTDPEAKTGNWLAKVKVGGVTFRKSLKIEAVKPNRLKIDLDFGEKLLHSDVRAGTLTSKWLHGAPASNLKAVVEMKVSQGHTKFENYKDFCFDDASKQIYGNEKSIFEGKLNAEGKANIPLDMDVKDAPGMVKVNFKTRVFEQGGDFSIDRFSKLYSPYKTYVGVKIPKGKGWNSALYSDETNLIPIVSVDEYGKPVSRSKIRIDVYEISWQWWWQRNSNEDLGYYIRSNTSKKILSDYISTKNGKAIYQLKFPKDTWGRKYIKITDETSGHSCGQIFYTDYKGWWSNPDNAMPGGAEMLSFTTDKNKYKVGDEVKIKLPSSGQGKALISIENGSKLIQAFWTDVAKGKQQIKFTLSKEMTPNVYIHISYIQPHSQTENDRPIRLYGVQGILVEDGETHLNPVVEMPDELRPEKKVTIKVKEKDGKKMTYTVAVVDEGLLDLTRFRTPNPWNTFYAKEALGVKTYDLYNYVMGAFSGNIAGLLAVGGDEDLIEKGNKKASRFKPVVKFLGPFTLEAGAKNVHSFTMPNYIGSVRTMIVAGDDNGAYGKAEKTTAVKNPLMVLASLPRVLGPQEKLTLPVTVFVTNKQIKNVKVQVETNDLFKIEGGNVKNIHFDKEGDQIVNFDLQVARKVGIGKVKVKVSGAGETASYEVEMNVRIANPEIFNVKNGVMKKSESWTEKYTPIGIIGTNKAVLELSLVPPINLEKRLDYLIKYPHGCIEQTTSAVFPQLFLEDLLKLSNERKATIQDNISQALQQLKKFQLTNGGFTYWPGQSGYASEWGTNYAGHFLLEAKKKGYKLPVNMLKDWISYQKKRANDWSPSKSNKSYYLSRSSQMIQAYRLYTLALAGKPVLGAMNRMRETTNLYVAAQWRLIAAYYLAGKKAVAEEMMKNLPLNVDKYTELGYAYGSKARDEAMILETLTLLDKPALAKPLLDNVSYNLSSNQWMNTQTTAYSLLAISKFVSGQKTSKIKCKVKYPGGNKTLNSEKPMMQIPLDFSSSGVSTVKVDNLSEGILFARIINTGIPLESDDLASSNNLDVRVNYYDIKGAPIDPAKLKQGTDLVVEVSISHPGILQDYKNMALTQIFPSGWEITNSRMDNIQRWKSDASSYQDIRDDRIMTYFDLKKYDTKTFRVLLNASYLGEYYMPSIKCTAMYDNNIISVSNGKWIKVVE
jgi:uncharacterized protein YfaS (alpha-2-macroglobulin family)